MSNRKFGDILHWKKDDGARFMVIRDYGEEAGRFSVVLCVKPANETWQEAGEIARILGDEMEDAPA